MTAKILEGKSLASERRANLRDGALLVKEKTGRAPFLFAIDPQYDTASSIYLDKEIKACAQTGIEYFVEKISPDISADKFIDILSRASADKNIDAVLVPRPLPKQLDDISIWSYIAPEKDIDGTGVVNMGKLFSAKNFDEIGKSGSFVPCTALAVVLLIKHHGIKVSGKHIAVLGRSSTVGRPLAHMLSAMDATVSLCHSKTENLAKITATADIVVSAIGKARFVKSEMIKQGAIVIDVGTNVDENGVFCGDIDFERVKEKASQISPVPGGVGPITLTCLLENIIKSAYRSISPVL